MWEKASRKDRKHNKKYNLACAELNTDPADGQQRHAHCSMDSNPGLVDEWMDEWMDERIEWMDEWMGEEQSCVSFVPRFQSLKQKISSTHKTCLQLPQYSETNAPHDHLSPDWHPPAFVCADDCLQTMMPPAGWTGYYSRSLKLHCKTFFFHFSSSLCFDLCTSLIQSTWSLCTKTSHPAILCCLIRVKLNIHSSYFLCSKWNLESRLF